MKVNFYDVVDVISGGTPRTDVGEFWNGEIPWLSVVDFAKSVKYVYDTEKHITELGLKNSNTKLLNIDDIIISARGTVGAIAMLKIPMAFNQSCFGLRAKREFMNQDYLFYFLKYYMENLKKKTQGSVFSTINLETFRMIDFELPDTNTQIKISKILSCLDSKIENNNKINAELESMAKTLYDYWFLQFEFPNENGKPYKSSGGKMVWNEELKREIPEGWEVRTVKDCADVVSGYPFKTETYSKDGKYKIYTIGNVQDGYIDDTCPNKIDFIPDDMDRGCILKPCDIIMSLTGNVGRVGLVYTKNALLNQRVLKVEPLEGYHNFLYLLFRNSSFSRVMQRIASGTSQKNLSPNQVCDFKFAIPKKSLLDLFNKKVNGFIKAIVNNLSQNQELTSLRDFLLPLLMNGQVKFKD